MSLEYHIHQWERIGAGQSSEVYRCHADKCRVCPNGYVLRVDRKSESGGVSTNSQEAYFSYYMGKIRPQLLALGVSPSVVPNIQLVRHNELKSAFGSNVGVRLPHVFLNTSDECRTSRSNTNSSCLIERSFPPPYTSLINIEWKLKSCVMPVFCKDPPLSAEDTASMLFCRYCMQHADETLCGIPFCPFEIFDMDNTKAVHAFARCVLRSLRRISAGQHKASLQIHRNVGSGYALLHCLPHIWGQMRMSGVIEAIREIQRRSKLSAVTLAAAEGLRPAAQHSNPNSCTKEMERIKNVYFAEKLIGSRICQSPKLARQAFQEWKQVTKAYSPCNTKKKRFPSPRKIFDWYSKAIDDFYTARCLQDCSVTVHWQPSQCGVVYPSPQGVHVIDLDDKRTKSVSHYALQERNIAKRFCEMHRRIFTEVNE